MFTNTFDALKLEFDTIRESVAKQNGDLLMIDYLIDNVGTTYQFGKDKQVGFKGFPWMHLEELKEYIGDVQYRFIDVKIELPIDKHLTTINLRLYKAHERGAWKLNKEFDTCYMRTHWIRLAKGEYNYNKDLIRPQVMSTPFNLITGAMVDCGHSVDAGMFRPFLEQGDVLVELYGIEYQTFSYKLSMFEKEKDDCENTLPKAMRDIRYGLAGVVDRLVTVNIKDLMLINVTFRLHGDSVASFQITRDTNGKWTSVTRKVPDVYGVLPLKSECNEKFTYPVRFVPNKVKNAPPLTSLMKTLEDFHVVLHGGCHACLSAELIQSLHAALEHFVSKGDVYLTPMNKNVKRYDNGKIKSFVFNENNVELPGLDTIGNVMCCITHNENTIGIPSDYKFTSLNQCQFTTKGIVAYANQGVHQIAITVEFDFREVEVSTLLSALDVIAAKAVVAEKEAAKQ